MSPCRFLMSLLLLLLPLAGPVQADPAHSPILPDPKMTPGDVLTMDATAVCQPGYAKSVRNVPQSVKNQVYRQYGVTSRQPHEYEVDHLISLQLGGSNSIRNLWPQSFVTQPLNAYVKDRVENKLHELVCSGQLPLEQAQREIASNWIEAYKNSVGPLPATPPGAAQAPAAYCRNCVSASASLSSRPRTSAKLWAESAVFMSSLPNNFLRMPKASR